MVIKPHDQFDCTEVLFEPNEHDLAELCEAVLLSDTCTYTLLNAPPRGLRPGRLDKSTRGLPDDEGDDSLIFDRQIFFTPKVGRAAFFQAMRAPFFEASGTAETPPHLVDVGLPDQPAA